MTDPPGNLQRWSTCAGMFLSCPAEEALKTVASYAVMGGQPHTKSRRMLHGGNLPQSAMTNSSNPNLITIWIRFWAVIIASQGYLKEVFNREEQFLLDY